MSILSNEYQDRLKHWNRVLQQDFYHQLGKVDFEGFSVMEQLTPEQASQGEFVPIPKDFKWGNPWEYLWLKGTIVLPVESEGMPIVMDLRLSGESTLFVNMRAFGTLRAEWVTTPHHFMVDNFLTEAAVPGTKYDLLFEVYAGHWFPGTEIGPIIPESVNASFTEKKSNVLGQTSFGIWNEDAYQLWMDVSTLQELLVSLPETSLRADQIACALETYTHLVDFEQDLEKRKQGYRATREMLKPLLNAHNGTTVAQMHAIGNSHLDLAWLWPMQETYRKTARTFAQQLRLIERYPEYRYLQSQPASYEMCRDHYPELYARIKKAVLQGQWIADGAMYVEPDTNMTSGESLIRQLMYGKRFFMEEFGIDSRMLWLPDTFGYTAALPQILKGCGVDYLVTQKIFWSYNDGDRFPYHYFKWKGNDGSEITSFLPTSYTYYTRPSDLCKVWNSKAQKRGLNDFLIPFGYGDGGGGPCRDHIEYILREKDLEGMPKVKMESPVEMFDHLQENGGPKDTWVGELYFSAHRGVYTSQAMIKKNNRLGEISLREAELWGTLSEKYSYDVLVKLWKTLLLNQFHDILPGSSIARVYEEANAALVDLQNQATNIAQEARDSMVLNEGGLTIFNSLSFPRTAIVPLPDSLSSGAVTADGVPCPVYNGYALVEIPSVGHVSLLAGSGCPEVILSKARLLEGGGAELSNDIITAVFNELGEITSFVNHNGREYVQSPMNRFMFFKDVPRKFDAWDIDSNYVHQQIPMEEDIQLEVICPEGLEASLFLTRKFGSSVIKQIISLRTGSHRIDFETEVAWFELHRLLKVSFPVKVLAEEALHEIQFGYISRPTHRSRAYDKDRFEVCNHRYTALCDANHGCAILNDSKYGISVNACSMELTLLRASAAPELRADNGVHHFKYSFDAWEGPFIDSPVVKDGYDLNVPVTYADGWSPSFSAISLDADNVILETLKYAEDKTGDLILRLYESKKADTVFSLKINLPIKEARLCDMLERAQEELVINENVINLHTEPFQVITLRIKVV